MNIITFLNEQKEDPHTINPKIKEGLDYLDNFFAKKRDNLSFLIENTLTELVIAYFTSISPQNLEMATYIANKYRHLFNKANLETFRILLFISSDEDYLKAYYSEGLDLIALDRVIRRISCKYDFSTFGSLKLLLRFFFRLDDFCEFIAFARSISLTTSRAHELSIILFTAADIQRIYKTYGDNDLVNATIKKTEKKLGKVEESCLILQGNYLERKREYSKEVIEVNKYNNTIQRAITILERNPSYVRPTIVDSLMSLNLDNKTKNAILDYIYSINKQAEAEILKSYEEAKTSSKEVLLEMLSAYNIEINSLSKEELESLRNISSLKLRKMLDFFFRFLIPIDSISRLAFIDIETIDEVIKLLQNGVLTAKFIASNLNILEKDSSVYNLIINNLNLLANMDINIRNYPESLSILLIDLSYPLLLLNKYGININNRTKDISFLAYPDLEAKLDLLIETGNDLNALPNYDILNYSLSELYLCVISQSLDIEYSKDLFAYFDATNLMPKCYLPIPEYLRQSFQNNYESTLLPENLEKYIINDNALLINGVYVSTNRLLKNLNCVDSSKVEELLYAILYGSYYNLEQVNLIREEIDSISRRI